MGRFVKGCGRFNTNFKNNNGMLENTASSPAGSASDAGGVADASSSNAGGIQKGRKDFPGDTDNNT